ncbi:MAG: adenine phosphoribosyltransferase [Euryarchaeota archaeon]|nr:adenine phosphoribosyltransferase [Euryarchaeota archaeon]|tara:strand:+ start:2251 stop:2772 length:522 start_codon:yes stop_codon:yes gene_type:complete
MPSKDIENAIRDIPDFPKKGIIFKDITPVLSDIHLLRKSIDLMVEPFMNQKIDVVVGIESRGFIFGTPIADKLNASFVPVRKPGKLPYKTEQISYELEYGTDSLEIHKDSIKEKQKILIVDDLLATGGTAEATCNLISKLKGNICGFVVLIELEFLEGRKKLNQYNVHSIVKY